MLVALRPRRFRRPTSISDSRDGASWPPAPARGRVLRLGRVRVCRGGARAVRHTRSLPRVLGLGFGLVVVGNLVQGYIAISPGVEPRIHPSARIWITAL